MLMSEFLVVEDSFLDYESMIQYFRWTDQSWKNIYAKSGYSSGGK